MFKKNHKDKKIGLIIPIRDNNRYPSSQLIKYANWYKPFAKFSIT